MTASTPLDGLILDNRQNGGGADVVARGALSYFTRGVVGHFVSRGQESRALNVMGVDVNGSSKVPLGVLVGRIPSALGRSTSGSFARYGPGNRDRRADRRECRAAVELRLEDGSRAWIAHENFKPRNHPDQNWEATGIQPDVTVASNWDEVTLQTDPAVQARAGFPGFKPVTLTRPPLSCLIWIW